MTTYGLTIPEWTDREAYPKRYEDIYEGDWRWQFLRRCPEYQQAWSRGMSSDGLIHPSPEDVEQCRTVFRLTHLVDPWGEQRIPNEPGHMHDAHTGALTINPPGRDAPRGPDFVMVGFDLNTPLKPQIDNAYHHLKYQQKALNDKLITFKRQKDKWPRYIRVIDAIDQGATPTDMYNQFAEEMAGDDEDKLDEFHRPKSQPDAIAMGWHSRALKVMEMAIRLL